MIHGPSVGIGAGITAGIIIATFFVMGNFADQKELVMEQTPTNEEAGPPKITMATFLENTSPVLGNPNAPITLVEFGDYQCHFCNVFFHNTEGSILKNFVETGKVKMVFKDYTIIGPDSVTAAHGAHCADDQGMFWEYHDILYNNWNGENNGWASSDNLFKFAQEVGLDMDEWSECMTNSKHSQIILASNNDAKALGLTGTPSFFVIGPDNKVTKIFGAQPYSQFEKIFNSMLEN
ncbi:thioredoxin domain-containing protein [Nitrosopumilus sp. K4]|uniref:DsbA family protein n=1 Tax=Nitrosopumilus sp. K4 TaxID=2795383 RepID=UPI001BA6E97F|nr:thioredoxin domain-containing protein [Nitrosopumilus sp. K4]QUC65409.1 thioredoxin domain-containing protein [Nitrosopumilus sp. K4]